MGNTANAASTPTDVTKPHNVGGDGLKSRAGRESECVVEQPHDRGEHERTGADGAAAREMRCGGMPRQFLQVHEEQR